jgi:hypothetical protein
MDTQRIVLISETGFVTFSELTKVSTAVQKQVNDHFGPSWGVRAAVDPLASLADIPAGSWPVVIRDSIGINQAGVHWNDTHDKPFALVTFREGDTPEEGWQPSVSHEVLEMLADPYGKEFRTAPSLRPDEGPVEYLVEVCDPCQAPENVYWIDDIPVSDFVLPDYYTAFTPGVYSYARHITQPRDVLPGGYLSWRDLLTPAPRWSQIVVSAAGPEFRDLGTNPPPMFTSEGSSTGRPKPTSRKSPPSRCGRSGNPAWLDRPPPRPTRPIRLCAGPWAHDGGDGSTRFSVCPVARRSLLVPRSERWST